jgi:hypothetical protein
MDNLCTVLIIATCDFHPFGHHKKHLRGQQFARDADMKATVTPWLQALDTNFCYAGIQAFMPSWDKHLNVSGDCVMVC